MLLKITSRLSPFILCIFLLSCMNASTSSGADDNPGSTDWPNSFKLSNGMRIDIFTPTSYDPNLSYPLLILNDGEHMFGKSSWNMDRILQDLIDKNEIHPLIAVAVYTQGKRNDWYIPYDDPWIQQNWGRYTSKADWYANELVDEVIPYLDNNYSIDKEEIGILGYSLGGLFSTWMGLNYPETIKYSAALSGSFWVADYSLFSEIEGPYNSGQKFWFDIGTDEWNYYVPLYISLDKNGLIPGESNFYYEVPGGNHLPVDWINRIDIPLKTFFGTVSSPEPESLKVELACIPSATQSGVYYRRLNPIVTLSNGVKYSLAHTATYELMAGDAQIGSEGSFRNNPDTEVQISVDYQTFSSVVTIPKGWCE